MITKLNLEKLPQNQQQQLQPVLYSARSTARSTVASHSHRDPYVTCKAMQKSKNVTTTTTTTTPGSSATATAGTRMIRSNSSSSTGLIMSSRRTASSSASSTRPVIHNHNQQNFETSKNSSNHNQISALTIAELNCCDSLSIGDAHGGSVRLADGFLLSGSTGREDNDDIMSKYGLSRAEIQTVKPSCTVTYSGSSSSILVQVQATKIEPVESVSLFRFKTSEIKKLECFNSNNLLIGHQNGTDFFVLTASNPTKLTFFYKFLHAKLRASWPLKRSLFSSSSASSSSSSSSSSSNHHNMITNNNNNNAVASSSASTEIVTRGGSLATSVCPLDTEPASASQSYSPTTSNREASSSSSASKNNNIQLLPPTAVKFPTSSSSSRTAAVVVARQQTQKEQLASREVRRDFLKEELLTSFDDDQTSTGAPLTAGKIRDGASGKQQQEDKLEDDAMETEVEEELRKLSHTQEPLPPPQPSASSAASTNTKRSTSSRSRSPKIILEEGFSPEAYKEAKSRSNSRSATPVDRK